MRMFVFILLCSSTTLLLCEFFVRYLQDTIPTRADTPYVVDPDCSYTLRPSAPDEFDEFDDRHVNALGFRDRDHDLARREDTRRIVGLGDSFVYGNVPIAHNFLRTLESELGDGHEVIITGLPGWDVRNATGLIRGKGPALRPDLAVLCFSVGSDVTGIPIPGAVYQGNLHFVGSQRPMLNLLRKSRLFVLAEQLYLVRVTDAVRGAMVRMRFGGEATAAEVAPASEPARDEPALPPGAPYFAGMWGEPDDPTTRTPCSAHNLRRQVHNLRLFREEPDATVEGWWDLAEQQLRDFDAACREVGTDWLLIIAPAEIQVDAGVQAEVLAHAPLAVENYDFGAPSRRLAAFAEAQGWAYIEPLAEFRAAQDERGIRHYIPNNGHWSVPGNGLMAGLVADVVR
ncbi:hypothetical protein H8E07_03010 [bacterium]|nr:hypothetical protein [bacterium]